MYFYKNQAKDLYDTFQPIFLLAKLSGYWPQTFRVGLSEKLVLRNSKSQSLIFLYFREQNTNLAQSALLTLLVCSR